MASPSPAPATQAGLEYIQKQDHIYFRQAWVHRWISWICGWGAGVLAASGVVTLSWATNDNHAVPFWCGIASAGLTAVTQTVKPDLWANAYYRGHLLLEQAIGDHVLGNATAEDLMNAWHQAQGGMPGAISSAGKN